MTVHAYTSFSFSYLNRARVWAASLRKQHPDWVIWAVITDKEPKGFQFDLGKEDFDHAVYADDLFGDITDRCIRSSQSPLFVGRPRPQHNLTSLLRA